MIRSIDGLKEHERVIEKVQINCHDLDHEAGQDLQINHFIKGQAEVQNQPKPEKYRKQMRIQMRSISGTVTGG